MSQVMTGLDRIWEDGWPSLKGCGLGLVANQASLDRDLRSATTVLNTAFPGQLKALFGPQHGYQGKEQDNMIETEHDYDEDLNIPVYSLYGETRVPLDSMLYGIDVLIIDLQDVGTRVYTFASTLLNGIRSASKLGKKVVVLDRPNPLGGEKVEGNLLSPEYYSFVGPYRLPMRHGLTMGELALLFNDAFGLGCDLEVIPMKGWTRGMLWRDTGLRWIMPSPNMPLVETALVYPGQVLWEGTNVSEGRGTCRPFEVFGAPFFTPKAIVAALEPKAMAGIHLQEYTFRPSFNKWQGDVCHGFFLHIVDAGIYRPYAATLALLDAVLETHKGPFHWKEPPYEYEYERMPIDLIMGEPSLRQALESRLPLSLVQERWRLDLEDYLKWRKAYLLYP